jgi:hypothetical protein
MEDTITLQEQGAEDEMDLFTGGRQLSRSYLLGFPCNRMA